MSTTLTGSSTPQSRSALTPEQASSTTPGNATDAGAQLPSTGPLVLDASFVIALLQRHPAATALTHVLPRGVLTTITAGEVFYKVASTGAAEPDRIEDVLRALGVRIIDLPQAAAHHFPRLRRIDAARRAEQKANAERAAALSLADLCVLSYAETLKLPVLTGDRHWTTLAGHGLAVPVHLYQR